MSSVNQRCSLLSPPHADLQSVIAFVQAPCWWGCLSCRPQNIRQSMPKRLICLPLHVKFIHLKKRKKVKKEKRKKEGHRPGAGRVQGSIENCAKQVAKRGRAQVGVPQARRRCPGRQLTPTAAGAPGFAPIFPDGGRQVQTVRGTLFPSFAPGGLQASPRGAQEGDGEDRTISAPPHPAAAAP